MSVCIIHLRYPNDGGPSFTAPVSTGKADSKQNNDLLVIEHRPSLRNAMEDIPKVKTKPMRLDMFKKRALRSVPKLMGPCLRGLAGRCLVGVEPSNRGTQRLALMIDVL